MPKYAGFSGILENDFPFDSWKFSFVRFCEKNKLFHHVAEIMSIITSIIALWASCGT